ncbi:unnamed protein product [Nippostrongylus brasiliensis]|uniref:DUF202 domain-containing protein n=1 Tax=Nippostrongylus brasiliensis TaxID=27835 RepID=A0A0N4YJW1_NIPBR|nr:unnamed protein product [Nippostrongylus brasiliensis]
MKPAVENNLLHCKDVAGADKYFIASFLRKVYFAALVSFFQNFKDFSPITSVSLLLAFTVELFAFYFRFRVPPKKKELNPETERKG